MFFYEEYWFLGKIIRKTGTSKSKIKFLKKETLSFIWPKKENIADVENKFIFYGPVEVLGEESVTLRRSDLCKIGQKYKSIKKDYTRQLISFSSQ